MKRSSFLKTAAVTTLSATMMQKISKAAAIFPEKSREFYEVRTYFLKNDKQQVLVENYFLDAAIPALNRLGSRNIGVFTELKPAEHSKLYVFIPYRSLGDF
jgi:hypothetical protein